VPDELARPDAAAAPILEMRGITKSFFGVQVLRDVDLDIRPGEVHAVLGENGAGKSTLMKILAGAYQPDAGTIVLDGQEVRFSHPSEAQNAGVSIIYQEFTLLPERTVAQNIYLGREPHRGPFVDTAAMERATAELLKSLNVEAGIRPNKIVRTLSVAQQQTVEIAKALSFRSKVLVMDEPTAALSPHGCSGTAAWRSSTLTRSNSAVTSILRSSMLRPAPPVDQRRGRVIAPANLLIHNQERPG